MSSSLLSLLLLSLAFVVFASVFSTVQGAPGPSSSMMMDDEGEDGGHIAGMRNALEYLRSMDKYYSQAARPRPERERREDVASALMKLSQIRQHYSDVGRPRFGKRAFGAVEVQAEEKFLPAGI